jgi:LysR family transcriptional regulator, low CO2-responsive transcriptional regulator
VIACITAPDDPAAANGRLEASELENRRWLLREPGSGTRLLNEQFLADHGLKPDRLTLGSNGAIKQAARAGLGISLLSRATVEAELESARLAELQLREAPATRPWFLLRSASGPLRPAVAAFIGLAHATLATAAGSRSSL